MSIQAKLNEELFQMLPKIAEKIKIADDFGRNQIIDFTISKAMNTSTIVSDMSESELTKFQEDLISHFRCAEWIDDLSYDEKNKLYKENSQYFEFNKFLRLKQQKLSMSTGETQ